MNIHTNPASALAMSQNTAERLPKSDPAGAEAGPKYKAWTAEDDALAQEMREAGYSWPLINAALGGNARKRLERTRLTPEQKEARRLADRAKMATGINITWTEEQVEQLKTLYFEGLSFSLMAPKIGTSRSACIAKVRRLKLPPRIVTQTMPRGGDRVRTRTTYPKLRITRANSNSDQLRLFDSVRTDMETLRCVEVPSLDLKIDQLTDTTCRFIPGDACAEGGASYCGNTIFKRSLCGAHFALCYVKPLSPKVYAMRRAA